MKLESRFRPKRGDKHNPKSVYKNQQKEMKVLNKRFEALTEQEQAEWLAKEFADLDIIPLAEIQQPDETSFWLLPGLVSSTATLVYGETKVGKSFLVANMLASLLTGNRFLNKTPIVQDASVLMAVSDYGAREEYKERFANLGVHNGAVDIAKIDQAPGAEYWHKLRTLVKARGYKVLVVDHATGVIQGDINNREPWLEFWQKHLGGFINDGVAVIVVGHSSDKTYNGVKPTTPMGNSAATQFARSRIHIQQKDSNKKSPKRLLTTLSNNAPSEEIPVILQDNGVMIFDTETKTVADRRQERSDSTKARNQAIAELAVQAPDQSSNDKIGKWIFEQNNALGTTSRAIGTSVGRLLKGDKSLLTSVGSGKHRVLSLR